MSHRPLPPLLAETPYVAADFQGFEFARPVLLGGSEAILRVHLKNGTTLDLPATDAQLQQLLVILCEAYPQKAVEHVRTRWPEKGR